MVPSRTPANPDDLRTASVLVVDDDAAVRSSMVDVFHGAGHVAIPVADGDAAMRVLRTLRFDVLVVDLKMPRLDGISLLAALTRPPPVVTVSAFDLDGVPYHHVKSKISSHLSKPVHPEQLLDAVAYATRKAWRA